MLSKRPLEVVTCTLAPPAPRQGLTICPLAWIRSVAQRASCTQKQREETKQKPRRGVGGRKPRIQTPEENKCQEQYKSVGLDVKKQKHETKNGQKAEKTKKHPKTSTTNATVNKPKQYAKKERVDHTPKTETMNAKVKKPKKKHKNIIMCNKTRERDRERERQQKQKVDLRSPLAW